MQDYFFVDDSGSKEWETPYSHSYVERLPARNDQNLNFWRRNYFVLAGIYVSSDIIKNLNSDINQIKLKYFKTKHVEIKSVWLRNPDKRKKYYTDPYSVTDDDLLRFTEEWYSLFQKYPLLSLQAFVLDKMYFGRQRLRCTPLQKLTQVLFDRVELNPKKHCEIIFDQMDREIKTEKHLAGQILKISRKEINLGSFYTKYTHRQVRFESSKHSNLLQLADTVAYNVYRQFVCFGDQWHNRKIHRLPTYPFFEKIENNFYCNVSSKKVAGYGIVVVPSPEKIPWRKASKKPDQ